MPRDCFETKREMPSSKKGFVELASEVKIQVTIKIQVLAILKSHNRYKSRIKMCIIATVTSQFIFLNRMTPLGK